MNTIPPEIHSKGANGEYDTVVIEVHVCRHRKDGVVWSLHDLQDQVDQALIQTWPGWGMQAISTSLITEAFRRTTYTFVLSLMSQSEPEFLILYQGASEEKKIEMETRVAGAVEQLLSRTGGRISSPIAREIIGMMAAQICPAKTDPA